MIYYHKIDMRHGYGQIITLREQHKNTMVNAFTV